MLDPAAVLRFVDQQKRLLRQTYDRAWQRGVGVYQPDDDPSQPASQSKRLATAGLTGAALLAVLRKYAYEPPIEPDPVRRIVALYPSFNGINSMAGQLNGLATTSYPEWLAAQEGQPSGLEEWTNSNAWRLDAGASVAWAGEQAGFAEAANADGQFLYGWTTVGDTHVCGDCEVLATYPAMALGQWPTSPGAGDTECSVGCRCTWDTWGAPLPANYNPRLTPQQSDVLDKLSQRQADAIAAMMSDVQYLA